MDSRESCSQFVEGLEVEEVTWGGGVGGAGGTRSLRVLEGTK